MLDDIVSVSITRQTAVVTRQGFGIPCILSAEADEQALFSTPTKIYRSLTEMGPSGDGFDVNGVAYKKAAKIFSQNPKVDYLVVGKRSNYPLMTVNVTPIAQDNTDYSVTINGETFTHNSGAGATVATICAGLVALINAGAQDVLATDNTTDFDVEKAATPGGVATAGVPFTIEVNDRELLEQQNVTADPGVVADISAIRTAVGGNDDWYSLILDSYGVAEITAVAAEIETLIKQFIYTTNDADALTAVDTDIFSVLQALNYDRTIGVWNEKPHEGLGAAWAGICLPEDPGSITWYAQHPTGVAASDLTTAEEGYLKGKNANWLATIGGIDSMVWGVTIGGEYIDVIRGLDFVTARLKENVWNEISNAKKIPFTNRGISIIENAVLGVMKLAVSQSIFSNDPEPTVSVPLASEVDVTDKANRILPDLTFSAILAGAIHQVEIAGVVSV